MMTPEEAAYLAYGMWKIVALREANIGHFSWEVANHLDPNEEGASLIDAISTVIHQMIKADRDLR
jgi:hypothetical protein